MPGVSRENREGWQLHPINCSLTVGDVQCITHPIKIATEGLLGLKMDITTEMCCVGVCTLLVFCTLLACA